MADNKGSTGALGLITGGIVAIAVMIFIITGGELGGKKVVKGDADLPPVTSPTSPPSK